MRWRTVLTAMLLTLPMAGRMLAQDQCYVCHIPEPPNYETYCDDGAILGGRVDCTENMSHTYCSVEGYADCSAGLLALPSGQVVAIDARPIHEGVDSAPVGTAASGLGLDRTMRVETNRCGIIVRTLDGEVGLPAAYRRAWPVGDHRNSHRSL